MLDKTSQMPEKGGHLPLDFLEHPSHCSVICVDNDFSWMICDEKLALLAVVSMARASNSLTLKLSWLSLSADEPICIMFLFSICSFLVYNVADSLSGGICIYSNIIYFLI